MNITHIAVHLGGGVGTVVKNWINKDTKNKHTILLLNKNFYGEKQSNVIENLRGKYNTINSYIKDSDVVIIHFWNHPYLFEFLTNAILIECRLCIWSHVSGLNPPYVHTNNLTNYPDRFIFSSPISGENFIWTTGGVDKYLNIKKNNNNKEFVIGYIGTLDYSKIHPKFVNLCLDIYNKIPNSKFIICGTGNDEDKIKEKVNIYGMREAFEFKGFISNIEDIIPTFNVFGYPLNETHFGTCEQVLGEVMACGIEPIVLNNKSEKYIVNGYGKVSNNLEEYVNDILDIYNNQKNKSDLLKKRAIELYDIDKMINSWNKIFEELLKEKKSDKFWFKKCDSGYSIFLESIGNKYSKIILNGDKKEIKKLFDSNMQWRSNSKGSVFQYLEAFPEDEKLQELSRI